MIHRCQLLLVLPFVAPCKTQAKSSRFTGTMYSMYFTQQLNIRGLVVPLAEVYPGMVRSSYRTLYHHVPAKLYTHLPCPRTAYWRTRSGHLDSPHDSPLPPSAGCPTFYSPRDSPLYAFRFAVLCFVRQQNCSECASARVGWCEAPSHPSPTKFMFHGILGFPVYGFLFPYAW